MKINQLADDCLNTVKELDIQINHRIPKSGIENEIELCRLIGQQEAYYDVYMKLHELSNEKEG